MAINKETIVSVFDEKLTLMQWLKTINKALDEAVLTGVEVRQKGNATYSFVVTFEDGTELESNEFVLAQGESINGATIRNGHLYLSLTNGDELDAGNLKPVTNFTINASQHLIVNYGDGTSQDLGAIFSGNINIDGEIMANSIKANGFITPKSLDKSFDGAFERSLTIAPKTIKDSNDNVMGTLTFPFVNMRISNGKLNVVCCLTFDITATGEPSSISFSAQAHITQALFESLVPIDSGLNYGILDKRLYASIAGTENQIAKTIDNGYQYIRTSTDSYRYISVNGYFAGITFTRTGKYFIRYEANFII
jgi:hypothetical protein